MKRKSIVLFCTLTFLLGGCNFSARNSSDAPTPNTNSAGNSVSNTDKTVSPDTENAESNILPIEAGEILIHYQRLSKTYQNEDTQTDLLYTEYQKPTITISRNEAATSAIDAALSKEEENFLSYATNIFADAESIFLQNPDTFSTYYADCTYEPQRNDDSIISLRQLSSSYTGGAHGNYSYRGLNFDSTTGSLLSLSDISTDKETLLEEAESYIRSQLDLPRYKEALPDSSEAVSSAIINEILTEDTWYFTNSGITFISNTDVLGPHAAGAYFFTVPYQQMSTLKSKYYYTGPFELSAPVGSTITANLDGNEDIDAIYFDCTIDEITRELSCTFTINGTDYSSYLRGDDCHLSEGASGFDLEYYVIDLDTSDEYAEIAILDHGMSDDYVTYFFRYDRGSLTYLGYICDLLSRSSCKINGDGTLMADLPINLLETANTSVVYQLNANSLELIPQSWYYINMENIPEEYKYHEILADVTVYREKSHTADTVTLTPEDGPVSFPATDNEHWFMLKTSDDQLYYLYLEDFCKLESGQYATDVFKNLLQAG